jgi:hypothetical protein
MANIEQSRAIVKALVKQYGEFFAQDKTVDTEIIMDEQRDHYQVLQVGWEEEKRVYGCLLHLDIKNGKVWIQHNRTEFEVGEELAKLGLAKNEMVVGFHAPAIRPFTEYATS